MFALSGAGRVFILAGVFLVVFGLLLVFWHRIPFVGKLPGDLLLDKGGFQFFCPVVTCLVISIVLTMLVNVALRLFR